MNFVGIDIGSEKHVVAIVDESGKPVRKPTPFSEGASGYEQLRAMIGQPEDTLVAMEATGHYWQNLFAYLHSAGFQVALLNPIRTSRFAAEDMRRAKTDALDALGIARFAQQKRPAATPLPDEATRELAASIVAQPRPRFAIHGTGGSFVKYGLDPQEDQLKTGASPVDAIPAGSPPGSAKISHGSRATAAMPGEEQRIVGQPRRQQWSRDPRDAVAQAGADIRHHDVPQCRPERLPRSHHASLRVDCVLGHDEPMRDEVGWATTGYPRPFRRHQRLALDALDEAFAAGRQRAWVVLPPGAGKTTASATPASASRSSIRRAAACAASAARATATVVSPTTRC